jgi:hypothetical protein
LVLVSLIVGALGGAVAGGGVAYITARQSPQTVAVKEPPTVVAAPVAQRQVTQLTLETNSAVVQAVAKVRPAVVTVATPKSRNR